MNLNIGCIETFKIYIYYFSWKKMNLNIGCIETAMNDNMIFLDGLMNLNIGCIETYPPVGFTHIF